MTMVKLTIMNETGHTTLNLSIPEIKDQILDHPTHWVTIDGVLTKRESINELNWDTVEEVILSQPIVGGC